MACKVYHGYAVLVSTFILRFTGLGIYFIIGADFVVPLSISFGISQGIAAFFPSFYSSVALLIVVLSGYVQDQLTQRGYTVRPTFIVGSLCVGVGSLGGSYARTFPVLLVNSLVMGVGMGCTSYPANGILAQWFVKWRGTFLLLGMSGGGLGGFVYALATKYVMLAFHEGDVPCTRDATVPSACEEWRPALRAVGMSSSLLMLLASMFMRLPGEGEVEKYEGKTNQKEMVEAEVEDNDTISSRSDDDVTSMFMRLPGEGEVETYEGETGQKEMVEMEMEMEVEDKVSSRSDVDTEVTGSLECDYTLINDSFPSSEENCHGVEQTQSLLNNAKHEAQQPELSFTEVLKTRTAICMVCWSLVFAPCRDIYFIFLPSFAESIGLSNEVGQLALSLSGLSLMIGNLTLGIFADRFGHTLAMQVCVAAITGAFIYWPFCKSEWGLLFLSCWVGYFFTCTSLFVSILTNAYEHTAKGCIMTVTGFVYAARCPGLFIGPAITGFLVDNFVGFYVGAFFQASMVFISLIAVLLLPSRNNR